MTIFTQEIYDEFKGIQVGFDQTDAFFNQHKLTEDQKMQFYIEHADAYSVDFELLLKHVEKCKGGDV